MRHTFRRDQHDARRHREFLAFKGKESLSFEDLVDLVHPFVGMEFVFLTGLESIEANEDAFRGKKRALAHFLGVVDSVIFGSECCRMIHAARISRASTRT